MKRCVDCNCILLITGVRCPTCREIATTTKHQRTKRDLANEKVKCNKCGFEGRFEQLKERNKRFYCPQCGFRNSLDINMEPVV